MRNICSELFAALIRQSIIKGIKAGLDDKNGWGDRIRTHEWLDQNQLPYHLATPQGADTKNTIFRRLYTVILLIFSVSFICLGSAQAATESKYVAQLKTSTKLQSPIEAIGYDSELIYSDGKNLYLGTRRIDLINSFLGAMQEPSDASEYRIYQILNDGEDIYLATSIGLFHNYKRVFNKGQVRALELNAGQIYIATDTGIYQATVKQDTTWTLIKGSPVDLMALSLDDSGKLEYAASKLGFYYYDTKNLRWLQRSAGLKQDFNNSYDFRKIIRDKNRVIVTTSNGLYYSEDHAKSWLRSTTGLKANSDGYYKLRDLVKHGDDYFLATSQGLYYSSDLKNTWQEITLSHALKAENNNSDIYSLLSHAGTLYTGSSQGEIYTIGGVEAQAKPSSLDWMRRLLSQEPSIQEVQAIALRFAGLPAGEDFRRYRRQARLRHLIPNFESFGTSNTEDLLVVQNSGGDNFNSGSGSLTSSYDRDSRNQANDEFSSGIRASWQLSNLIYDPEINDINNSARTVSNIRENLLTEVTQIYFARRELQYQILNYKPETPVIVSSPPPATKSNKKKKEEEPMPVLAAVSGEDKLLKDKLKLAEYTAQIDARTGSWFSSELSKRYKGGEYEIYFGT